TIQIASAIISTPNDHFVAGPDCGVIRPGSRRISGAGSCPTVRSRIVTATAVYNRDGIKPTPHNHLAAGPDCGVIRPRSGRAGSAGSCPYVGARAALARSDAES